jgi:hypothetical protein
MITAPQDVFERSKKRRMSVMRVLEAGEIFVDEIEKREKHVECSNVDASVVVYISDNHRPNERGDDPSGVHCCEVHSTDSSHIFLFRICFEENIEAKTDEAHDGHLGNKENGYSDWICGDCEAIEKANLDQNKPDSGEVIADFSQECRNEKKAENSQSRTYHVNKSYIFFGSEKGKETRV